MKEKDGNLFIISVILPVYNGSKTIQEAVQSVLNQTYNNFELIIINDGSTDSTRSIIESFKDKRIIIINQVNKGLVNSLNLGIQRSRGIYIARMDADDYCLPKRFEKQIRKLESNPNLAAVGSLVENRYPSGDTIIKTRPLTHAAILKRIVLINPFSHSSVMMRKTTVESVGMYNPETDGSKTKLVEDYDLWIKFIKSGFELENINEVLMQNSVLDESIMNKKGLKERIYQKTITRVNVIKELNLSLINYLLLLPVISITILQFLGLRTEKLFKFVNKNKF